jgi:hypothetical protein
MAELGIGFGPTTRALEMAMEIFIRGKREVIHGRNNLIRVTKLKALPFVLVACFFGSVDWPVILKYYGRITLTPKIYKMWPRTDSIGQSVSVSIIQFRILRLVSVIMMNSCGHM